MNDKAIEVAFRAFKNQAEIDCKISIHAMRASIEAYERESGRDAEIARLQARLNLAENAIGIFEQERIERDAEIAEWKQCAEVEAGLHREARAEIARLNAIITFERNAIDMRIERLREVLTSFAEWLNHYERWHNELDHSTLISLPLGYLFSARAALGEEGK